MRRSNADAIRAGIGVSIRQLIITGVMPSLRARLLLGAAPFVVVTSVTSYEAAR